MAPIISTMKISTPYLQAGKGWSKTGTPAVRAADSPSSLWHYCSSSRLHLITLVPLLQKQPPTSPLHHHCRSRLHLTTLVPPLQKQTPPHHFTTNAEADSQLTTSPPLQKQNPSSPGVLAQPQGLGHAYPDVEDEGDEVDEHDGAPQPVDFDPLAVLVGLLLLCRQAGHRHFRQGCCSATAQDSCCGDRVGSNWLICCTSSGRAPAVQTYRRHSCSSCCSCPPLLSSQAPDPLSASTISAQTPITGGPSIRSRRSMLSLTRSMLASQHKLLAPGVLLQVVSQEQHLPGGNTAASRLVPCTSQPGTANLRPPAVLPCAMAPSAACPSRSAASCNAQCMHRCRGSHLPAPRPRRSPPPPWVPRCRPRLS